MDKLLKTKTAKRIIKEIEDYAFQNSTFYVVYENWYCGITNNPTIRRNAHKTKNKTSSLLWIDFNARSVKIALAIETYFHSKGMLNTDEKGGYDKENSKYIYVYKKHPTILD